MNAAISIMSIQQLFSAARTHHAWQDRDIADGLLHEIYDLFPTTCRAATKSITLLLAALGAGASTEQSIWTARRCTQVREEGRSAVWQAPSAP
jgi:hypothetical protein